MKEGFSRQYSYSLLIPILIGIAVFIFVTGGKILWETNSSWLMVGDASQHWLGWQFFRHTPIFQWPLGANPSYGMNISSSIVYSDSIPLFAFLFKPLSSMLPEAFQYFGLWILLCFCLQAYFSWKILSLFTEDKWQLIIGCVFFTIAPVCLFRINIHMALFGQWVILAGLYL